MAEPALAGVDGGGGSRLRELSRLEPYVIEDPAAPLPLGPVRRRLEADRARHGGERAAAAATQAGVESGTLENGLRYFVLANAKPEARAALALVVRVGSLAEEEDERGAAHIVEHLAFNATERFKKHDIVHFLESIGAAFGACSNAYTSCDETVYELLVPIDKPGLLRQALEVLAEFACKVRIAAGDLENERGAVLEEWRQTRSGHGRAEETAWRTTYEGSRYAERLPIGLESVIRGASAATVRGFYTKWYRPEHMAIVAVGDFPREGAGGVADVVAAVRAVFGAVAPPPDAPPRAPPRVCAGFAPHAAPRVLSYADRELTESTVAVSWKRAPPALRSAADYRRELVEELFASAIGHRLLRASRVTDPPFYSASVGLDTPVAGVGLVTLAVASPVGGVARALEAALTELARVRAHGFTPRELALARATLEADLEAGLVEREQCYSTGLRDEYVRHFLAGEMVVGPEGEARLAKALLPGISAAEVAAVAAPLTAAASCVVKAAEHRRVVGEEALAEVLRRVAAAEAAGAVPPPPPSDAPEQLLEAVPPPGAVVARREWPGIGATELLLSNGMRVALKRTTFLDDQVLLGAVAVGGLSEATPEAYPSVSCAAMLAAEVGVFGLRPEVLTEVLAGTRAEAVPSIRAFTRHISGDQSPADLEAALQLVHRLFASRLRPTADDVAVLRQLTVDAIRSQRRDPLSLFSRAVKALNYGPDCHYDFGAAAAAWDAAFSDPAEWTLCLVGALPEDEEAALLPLLLRYLGSIPRPPGAAPPPARPRAFSDVAPVRWAFPAAPAEREVRAPMAEPFGSAAITWPVVLANASVGEFLEESEWLALARRVLEARLMKLLRFRQGEVYGVSVSTSFALSRPGGSPHMLGDAAASFSCDPAAARRLADLALGELELLQSEGPSAEDVATAVELQTRAAELARKENGMWLERLLSGLCSARMDFSPDRSHAARDAAAAAVAAAATPAAVRDAFRRLWPCPARSRYTAVVLLPHTPLWRRALGYLLPARAEGGGKRKRGGGEGEEEEGAEEGGRAAMAGLWGAVLPEEASATGAALRVAVAAVGAAAAGAAVAKLARALGQR